MKTTTIVILICLAGLVSSFAQERTDETKVTVNPETGDTTFTESIVISQSSDITPRNHMLVINPLKFILFYNISYFQKVSDRVVVGGGVQMPTISELDGFGANPFSFGVLVGWQWFPGDQFAIGFGIGLDYYIGTIEEDNGDFERYNGTVPALRFDIGYPW
jgi:hypothetical protein